MVFDIRYCPICYLNLVIFQKPNIFGIQYFIQIQFPNMFCIRSNLQILLFVTTLPGYEGDAEQREAVDEEGRGIGDATAAVKDSQQRGQVGGSLDQAGEAEVEMEAGAGASDLAHVER